MPKRTTGLGGGKAPVRGLTQLLKELDGTTKNILNSAFSDAENLLDFHNRTVPQRQTRRRIAGLVKTLILRGESNLLGGFLSWDRLDDPRIAMYEVQVGNDNVFANPETFQVLESFFGLENLRTVKFCRVRGVRADGQTGLWSNVVRLTPRISAPSVLSLNFYQQYMDAEPKLTRFLRYSGGNAGTHAEFYSIFSQEFDADRLIGGMSVWGYLSTRLQEYMDGGRTPWDRVRFKVNDIARLDGYFPHWTNVHGGANFHQNERTPSGQLLTFYGRGGYTASFGPYAVTLPNVIAGFGPNDPHRVTKVEDLSASFYWLDPMNSARASRFDEAQFASLNDTINAAHETSSPRILEGQHTEWLKWDNFKFNIPEDRVIRGIEAKIKRRQFSQFTDPLPRDSGKAGTGPLAGVNMALDPQNMSVRDIRESAEIVLLPNGQELAIPFGRFLFTNFTGVSNVLEPQLILLESEGKRLGIKNNRFSLAMWLNPLALPPTGRFDIFTIYSNNNPTAADQLLNLEIASTTLELRARFGSQGGALRTELFDDFFVNPNRWVHLAITWDGLVFRCYRNGLPFGATTTSGSILAAYQDIPVKIGILDAEPVFNLGPFRGGICQVAIWDDVLNDNLETREIVDLTQPRGFADLRFEIGRYELHERLLHYWLFLPNQADVRDQQVNLVDENGFIRTDLDNKAIPDESWPRLSQFFYTDLRLFGVLPLALSDGVPHDNHTAIGYETYGGENDLWGRSSWTPAQINSFYFGLALEARNEFSNGFPGYAYVDHAKITVYTAPEFDRTVKVDLEVAASNEFYSQREVFGAIVNLIELGERLARVNV